MTSTAQTRSHAGHSHHHHHHHDNTFLVSKNKSDAGVRITRVGLYVNLGMAVSKGVGGYVFHSQALLADAIHSLTDLVSDVLTLATVGWSLKPPSPRFPSGYGKIESLGALGVSGILLAGGFLMGWSALINLSQQFFPEAAEMASHWGLLPHSHGHHHGAEDLGPNINAAWLAAASIVIKEWLYRATLKVANERKSAVLASNAYHHRVDSLTAFVALLLIVGSNFFHNAQWLDPVGGLVISLMVVQAGWGNTKQALLELADVGVDSEMKGNVHRAATAALEAITTPSEPVNVRAIQGVKAGQNYLMDVELGVPGTWTVVQTRRVEDLVRERVGAKVRGVKKVRVRFVNHTAEEPDFLDEFIPGGVDAAEAPEAHDHDHGLHHSDVADGSARKSK
ncbi:mitochondrial metal transporter [Pleosporales sp. CAS-2024a]